MAHEQVEADFDRALTKAFLRNVSSVLLRQPNSLLPYHEVKERLRSEGESYRGMQAVPVQQIVGSVDRYRDFDRAFLPKRRHTAARWKSIDRAYYQDIRLPPIQLYKMGDVYFVKDGNHRVSVAREHGIEFIDAEVIEVQTRAFLAPSMSPSQLLQQVEYSEFLRRTDLDRTRPKHDIRPTALGRYDELLTHIDRHRSQLMQATGLDISLRDAAAAWYDDVYLPVVLAVRDLRLLSEFANRTEADVYLWVMNHQDEIRRDYGEVDPRRSASAYRTAERRQQPVKSSLRRFWFMANRAAKRVRNALLPV
jgi:hypothetical protein